MKVVWTEDSLSDLENLLDFIARSSPQGAPAVAQAIDATAASISHFPNAGRPDIDTGCRERLVGRHPLLIVYRVRSEHVEVIAVFHTSRDPAIKRKPRELDPETS